MNKAILLSNLVIISCATTGKYDEGLQSWVGKSESDLISQIGIPTAYVELSSGRKILEYYHSAGTRLVCNISFTGSCNNGATVVEDYCDTRYTTDKNGIIIKWSHSGNKCKSR